MGAVGSAYDNAMVESFWGRMQVELFNRKRWATRIELATAVHDYIELFHSTRRRHSALAMLSPSDYEAHYIKTNTRTSTPNVQGRSPPPTNPGRFTMFGRGAFVPRLRVHLR